MDFDDLLMKTVLLFRQHPDVLAHYQQRFQHVLIDEYQDTNTAQNEIALLLAAGHQQITIVGDSDQCLPPGTMVSHPDGSSGRSSRSQVGDVVARHRRGGAASHRASCGTSASGHYNGPLVTRHGGRRRR